MKLITSLIDRALVALVSRPAVAEALVARVAASPVVLRAAREAAQDVCEGFDFSADIESAVEREVGSLDVDGIVADAVADLDLAESALEALDSRSGRRLLEDAIADADIATYIDVVDILLESKAADLVALGGAIEAAKAAVAGGAK